MDRDSFKRYYVFISYNHRDARWAKWLQKKLEWYRLPTEIQNEFGESRFIRPVFRDRDNLTSGVLNEALQRNLETSQYLVVICSPNSADSKWVSEEIEAFVKMGGVERVVPFIVEGTPHGYSSDDYLQPLDDECYPLALRRWNAEHPDKTLLGIAVNDDGRINPQKSFIRLVSHLLGVEFDVLWRRHRRFIRRMTAALMLACTAMLFLGYWFMAPVRLDVTLLDERSSLPGMERGTLVVNGSEYPVTHLDTTISADPLPGYRRKGVVPIRFDSDRFYLAEQMEVKLGMGIRQHVLLQLHRDSTFAVFSGILYDGGYEDFEAHPVDGATVFVGERELTSDEQGRFRVIFPLDKQERYKAITIVKPGFQTFHREDESPHTELRYLLHRQ